MPTIYGANASPFVRKVRVVHAEKGVPYELIPVFPGAGVPPEFQAMSPLSKIPAYRDGDRTLADSSVICAYVERVHPTPPLYPSDPYDYARALWFEEYGDGGMTPIVGGKLFFQLIVGPRFMGRQTDQKLVEEAKTVDLPKLFTYLDGELTGREFLVGDALSIGDIGIATQFVNLGHVGIRPDAKQFPHLAAYVSRMLARPSFAALVEEETPQFAV